MGCRPSRSPCPDLVGFANLHKKKGDIFNKFLTILAFYFYVCYNVDIKYCRIMLFCVRKRKT